MARLTRPQVRMRVDRLVFLRDLLRHHWIPSCNRSGILEQPHPATQVARGHTVRNVILALVVFALSITNGGVISAQSNAGTTESRNKSIVEASFKAWDDGTGSPYDLLTDDATWTIVGRSAASKTYQGREAFMRDVIRPFNARMREPLKPVIRRIYTDRDAVIVFFDAKGTARDGKPYANTYAWFLDMRDGRVTAASAFFDSLEFNELWTRVTPATAR
jgi:ketosteroid isomerase-like protein